MYATQLRKVRGVVTQANTVTVVIAENVRKCAILTLKTETMENPALEEGIATVKPSARYYCPV